MYVYTFQKVGTCIYVFMFVYMYVCMYVNQHNFVLFEFSAIHQAGVTHTLCGLQAVAMSAPGSSGISPTRERHY